MSVDPPRPRPAPLTALRSFEAAARLGGFAAAAIELGVTAGAVSQQVRVLETWAGAPLFERRAQGVALTALGARAAADLGGAFDRLGAASNGLRAAAAPQSVSIAALPSIAQLWLAPRLPGIRAAAGGVRISVSALEAPPNLMREPFDIALFFEDAPGAAEGCDLAPGAVFPVCAPAIAARLTGPEDLLNEALLTDAAWIDDWGAWADTAGAAALTGGATYSLYAIAVEEALAGAGVLMGRRPLIDSHLKSGALVAPFGEASPPRPALRLSAAASIRPLIWLDAFPRDLS
ncbi:MAG: LysR family transcriptional regulator [Pseudomonadota bacterium]